MANVTLATLDTVLLDKYDPAIQKCLLTEVKNWERFTMKAGNWEGKKHYFTFKDGRNQSAGARDESATLPTPGVPTYDRHYATPKNNYAAIGITGQAEAYGQKGAHALLTAMDESITDAIEMFTIDMNRQSWGTGSGMLARLSAASSASTTVNVDSTGGTRLIAKGMLIDIINAGGTKQVDGIQVASLSSTTEFEMASAVTCDDNALIYRKGNKDLECVGLAGIIDDGTNLATFQGLLRSNYDQLCAHVLSSSGVGRALTESLMMEALSTAYERADGRIDKIIMHPKMIRDYSEALITADRMFIISPEGAPKYQGGYQTEGNSFAGVMIDQDRDAPWGVVNMCQTDTISYRFAGKKAIGWIDQDGMIFRHETGKDSVVAYLRSYGNWACNNPMKNVRIDDISFTANTFIEYR